LPLPAAATAAAADDEKHEQDYYDDHDDDDYDCDDDVGDGRQREREREMAQMRDDENIRSISKFYFGASAERRACAASTRRSSVNARKRARTRERRISNLDALFRHNSTFDQIVGIGK